MSEAHWKTTREKGARKEWGEVGGRTKKYVSEHKNTQAKAQKGAHTADREMTDKPGVA
jgi:hypothetical protein